MPEMVMDKLRASFCWWTDTFRNKEKIWLYKGNFLPHGDQSGDTTSCGIVSYNAIARDLFLDALWSLGTRKQMRIEAFCEIVMQHNQKVSCSFRQMVTHTHLEFSGRRQASQTKPCIGFPHHTRRH